MKRALYFSISSILFLLSSAEVLSGTVSLSNGDSISGNIVSVDKQHIVWRSELLGDFSIPKQSIMSISSETPLKLTGTLKPCILKSFIGENLIFLCGQEEKRIALLTLKSVVVYENHRESTGFYAGKVAVVGSQTSGNKEKQDWLVDIDLTHRYTDFRHEYGLKYVSESTDGGPDDEEFEGLHAFDWFFSPRTYWYIDLSVNSDEAKQLQEKYTVGTGLGYQFWESQKTAYSVKTGGVYTNESYEFDEEDVEAGELLDESPQDFASWSVTSNFRYLLLGKFAFFNRADFLWSLAAPEDGERKDWSVQTDSGLTMPIAKGVSADIALEYDYDNSPQDDNQKEDSRLRFGVGYSW